MLKFEIELRDYHHRIDIKFYDGLQPPYTVPLLIDEARNLLTHLQDMICLAEKAGR